MYDVAIANPTTANCQLHNNQSQSDDSTLPVAAATGPATNKHKSPGGATAKESAMADTHHMLLYHFVFSTKNRRRWLQPQHQPMIFDYLGGTVRNLGGVSLRVGGWLDHVHLLVKLKTTHCVADFMRDLKSGTSKHFNETTASLQKFGWQNGYGAFTVSPFRKEKVIDYINRQEEHHRTEDSRTEYLRMLEIHELEYNEKYVDD